MKKKFLLGSLLGLSLVFSACEQSEQFLEPNGEQSEKELVTRVSFKDGDDFINTFCELSKKNNDEQLEWAKVHTSAPLLVNIDNCKDSAMLDMPIAFKAMFDENLEVQINDSVIKYINGELFYVSGDEKISCGKAFATSLDEGQEPMTRTQTNVTFGKRGMNHQYGFIPVNYKDYYTFKYVHELKSVHVEYIDAIAEALVMELKLEYKGSSWHEAGEQRAVAVQLTGTASVRGQNFSVAINPNNIVASYNDVRRNSDFSLGAQFRLKPGGFPSLVWELNLTGTITHYMVGYPETKWVDQW